MEITVPKAEPAYEKAVNLEYLKKNLPYGLDLLSPAPLAGGAPPGDHGQHGGEGDALAQALTREC